MKHKIRRQIRDKIKSYSELEKSRKSDIIQQRLFREEDFKKAKIVMFYVSLKDEVNTLLMIDEAIKTGKRVCIPVILKEEKRLIAGEIKSRKEDLESYTKYLVWRNMVPADLGMRNEVADYTAFSMLWRRRKEILGLWGNKCTSCGTPQWPPQRICANPNCGAIDKMEPYSFAEKKKTEVA